jgi:phosphoglycerol transferase
LVTFVACWYFRVWDGGLGTPVTYSGDALYYAGITKSIISHGWYFTDSNLGAPLGRVAYDYPLGYDNLNLAGIRVLASVSSNPLVVNNLFLYLTFPVTFLTAWFVLRRLGFSKPVAWVTGVVFAILPYHFWRADVHLMLAAYYVIPLGALLLYEFTGATAERDAGRAARPDLSTGSWRVRGARFVRSRWFWIPVLLGSAGVYYAAFFAFLAIAVGCLAALRDRQLSRLALPAICSVLVVVVLAINNAPTLLYTVRHGENPEAVQRPFGQNDIFGLGISHLVLPINNHRLPLFRHTKEEVTFGSVSPVGDLENQGLGMLASLGLVVSVGSLLIGVTNRGSGDRWSVFRRRSGEMNLLAILLATAGGISTIVGLIGFTSLRGYNRISIYIAFFSLVALGALCESWLARRKHRSTRFTGGVVAVSLAVCAFAVFDQTPRVITFPGQPDRSQIKARLSSDRAFAERIDRRLGPGAMVFQLPLMEYPEAALPASFQFTTDDLAKPSLFTDDLRWSWGAHRGRPQDLTPSFVGRPMQQLLPDLAALDFDGIYIDRRGFPDHGSQIEASLTSLLDGQRPLESRDRDLSFFDLRPYKLRYKKAVPEETLLAHKTAALNPLRLHWGKGFWPSTGLGEFYPALDGLSFGRSVQNGAVLEVTNPLPATRRLIFHFGAQAADAQPATLEVRTPQRVQRFNLPSDSPQTLELNVPSGKTRLSFRIDRDVPSTQSDPKPDFEIVNPSWEASFVAPTPVQ